MAGQGTSLYAHWSAAHSKQGCGGAGSITIFDRMGNDASPQWIWTATTRARSVHEVKMLLNMIPNQFRIKK